MALKVKCKHCGFIGVDSDILLAPSPFDSGDVLMGCYNCNSIESFVTLCDEPGCDEEATCGSPTPDGYRFNCLEHKPKETQ